MLDGEYQFPCGCWADEGGPHWGYTISQHQPGCNQTALAAERQQRRADRQQSRAGSNQRGTAPLYREPFSVLRQSRKGRW